MHSQGVQQLWFEGNWEVSQISIHALTGSATFIENLMCDPGVIFQFMHSQGVQPQHLANICCKYARCCIGPLANRQQLPIFL